MMKQSTRKKIVFVIVEGPSDETAVGSVLSHVFEGTRVFVHIVGGDITTQTPENGDIAAKVSAIVKGEASIYHWRASDIERIIHLVDINILKLRALLIWLMFLVMTIIR